ncbi:MAG: universal stress protein [Streptosporangiaceae bacterium]
MTTTLRPAQEPRPRRMPRGPARSRPAAMGVIVGVDGSAGSAAALQWAAAEACRRQATLRIVSVWQRTDTPGPSACAAIPAAVAASRVQDALDGLLRQHGTPRHVACATPRGEPGEMLVRQARGAALLVLGTSSSDDPGRTARYCLHYAPCPVVFVSP